MEEEKEKKKFMCEVCNQSFSRKCALQVKFFVYTKETIVLRCVTKFSQF